MSIYFAELCLSMILLAEFLMNYIPTGDSTKNLKIGLPNCPKISFFEVRTGSMYLTEHISMVGLAIFVHRGRGPYDLLRWA